jgi:outer membrane protein assembly factor BamB/TolB-like protein
MDGDKRRFAAVVLAASMLCAAAPPPSKARRIAVLEFQNVTQEKALDWIGTGMKEELTSQLSQIPEFVVVERARLGDAIKELNFNRSQYVDPAAAQKMGKMLGAQSVVVGSYQKFEDTMRIHARLVDVETGEVKSPIRVDGSYKKFLDLESEVAKKLVAEMKGALSDSDRKQLETKPTSDLDAHRLFSDGVYFLRNDLVDDAVAQFDKALEVDPNYGEAWFYKGLALQKRQRWDDSINALKRALPSSQAVRPVKWGWQPPFEQEKSERGRIQLIDIERRLELEQMSPPAVVAFGEHVGKQTVMHFLQLNTRKAERFVFDDPNVSFRAPGFTAGARAAFQAAVLGKDLQEITMETLDAANRRTYARTASVKDGMFGYLLLNDLALMFYPRSGQWYGIDPATGAERWQRSGLDLAAVGLSLGRTPKSGLVIVGQSTSTKKLRAVRADTGEDLWSADIRGKSPLMRVRDGMVAVLDPEETLAAFDLETGKPIPLPEIALGSDRREAGLAGSLLWVPAILRNQVLYVWTKEKTLIAVDLNPEPRASSRILWRIPMENAPSSAEWDGEGVYVATRLGEVFFLDARTGKQRGMIKLTDKGVNLDEVGKGVIVASSADAVYLLDTTNGKKKWEYPNKFANKQPRYFKGAVIFNTGNRDLACLDAETGTVIWQHSGVRAPTVHITADSLFIADEDGVKEYSTERPAVAGIADKEVYTELARTNLLKGDLREAQVHAAKVLTGIDSNYAPARLVEARVLKAQGDRFGAGRDLATFLMLEGLESNQGREVLAELKKNHGLVWHTDAESPTNRGYEIQGKIINILGTPGEDLRLYAFDRDTGRVAWNHPGQRLMRSYPDPQRGRVFQLAGRRESPNVLDLFAVAVATGERRKVATLTSPREANGADLTYAAGTAYIAAVRLDFQAQRAIVQMVAMDSESGKIRWEKSYEQTLLQPPVLWHAKGNYLLYSTDKDLWCVNGVDGAVVAHHTDSSSIVPTGFLWEQDAPKDVFYYATRDQAIVAFDLAKGQAVWRARVPGLLEKVVLAPSTIHNGVLYDWEEKSVFAVRLAQPALDKDLTILWKVEAGSGITFRQMILDRGRVFALRSDSVMLELDPATGKLIREYPLLWEPRSVVVNQNTAYVFSTAGRAYALNLGTTDASK